MQFIQKWYQVKLTQGEILCSLFFVGGGGCCFFNEKKTSVY